MSDLDDTMKALALLAASHVESRDEHDPCDDCGAEGGKPCDEDYRSTARQARWR